jgi:hypothetical protein
MSILTSLLLAHSLTRMIYTSTVLLIILVAVKSFHLPGQHRHSLSRKVVMMETVAVEEQYKQIKASIIGAVSSKMIGATEEQKVFTSIFTDFLEGYYSSCLAAGESPEKFKHSVFTLLKAVQSKDTFKFQPFHQMVREPFDYYTWGNDFMRPLIIKEQSRILGTENFKKIKELLSKGENVVILSNHQTEADAQVFSILLEGEGMSDLGEKSIFIAGHKVTNDPIAIPFSMGRNLICIHSKKHIKNPPEDMPRKSSENLSSMTVITMSLDVSVVVKCVHTGNVRADDNGWKSVLGCSFRRERSS